MNMIGLRFSSERPMRERNPDARKPGSASPKVRKDLKSIRSLMAGIVYQSERDRVHHPNQTAALILELCNGRNPEAALPELLQSAFDLLNAPVEEVEECLKTLRTEGLVA